MASLTEAAKAVLEGKSLQEGATLPTVGPITGGVSNPNPVDPSTASTANAKTLRPNSKSTDARHSNPGAADPASLSGVQDLGGQTPTQLPTENLGAKASGGNKRDTSVKGSGSNAEPSKKLSAMAEEMEDDGDIVEERTSLAERVRMMKSMRKMKDMEEARKCSMEEEEEVELSEELEDFIAEAIEAGLDEEEILAAIDENFEFVSEEYEDLDEAKRMTRAQTRARTHGTDGGYDDDSDTYSSAWGKKHSAKVGKKRVSAQYDNAGAEHGSNLYKGKVSGTKWRYDDDNSPAHHGIKTSDWVRVKNPQLSRNKSKAVAKYLDKHSDKHEMEEEHIDYIESYQVDMSEHVNALLQGENLSEDFHAKATTILESAVKVKVEEEVALLEQAYAETLEERLDEIMEQLASDVDQYLNYVVEQWIEENQIAVESALRSELTEDFISGLKSLFAEHYIDVPEDQVPVVEELSATVEELESKLNEEIQRNVELTAVLAESRKIELAATVCEGLTDTQTQKLLALVENVEYTDDQTFLEKVSTLRESYFPVAVRADKVLDRVESADPQTITEENLSGRMALYTKALGKSLPK